MNHHIDAFLWGRGRVPLERSLSVAAVGAFLAGVLGPLLPADWPQPIGWMLLLLLLGGFLAFVQSYVDGGVVAATALAVAPTVGPVASAWLSRTVGSTTTDYDASVVVLVLLVGFPAVVGLVGYAGGSVLRRLTTRCPPVDASLGTVLPVMAGEAVGGYLLGGVATSWVGYGKAGLLVLAWVGVGAALGFVSAYHGGGVVASSLLALAPVLGHAAFFELWPAPNAYADSTAPAVLSTGMALAVVAGAIAFGAGAVLSRALRDGTPPPRW